MSKTKIICTLGPSSNTVTVIRNMMLAGMDVVRLNFSHGSYDEYENLIDIVRILNKRYRRHIRILQDLEGFRIRIGALNGPIELKKRKLIWLTQEELLGEKEVVPFDYRGPIKDIKKGQFIYIDDGTISLKVKKLTKRSLLTEVVAGGVLKARKGINIPGYHLEFPSITEKDKKDIRFGIAHRVDYIAQSFVRDKKDVLRVRALIEKELPECQIIAKIENREGIRNIDEIIEASDGIMIARGDMGVCVPIYEIPIIQKQIIKKCNQKRKFVITATQMLEHMVEHSQPTRAEVTDIANAMIDGTDFAMLSAETATGRYPVEAVRLMNKIIGFTEASIFRPPIFRPGLIETGSENPENPATQDVSKAILTRRTIRRFKNKPIRYSILKELINAGRLAPSAANLQPVEFVVVDRRSLVDNIFLHLRWAGYIAPMGNPPEGKRPVSYIAVLINEKKINPIRNLKRVTENFIQNSLKISNGARMGFGSHDAAASIMNIILSAWERGIGCCWIQSFEEPAIRKILKVPSYIKIDSIIALGYKDEKPVVGELKGSVKYWKDENGVLHVPKRSLKDVLHRNAC